MRTSTQTGEPLPRDHPSLDIGVYGARGVPSTYSGNETFLTALLPELVARGHAVTVYCRRGEVDASSDYRGVHRVVLPAIATKQASTLSHGLLAGAVSRVARHDVVLVVNVANALFCLLSRLTGQRVVLNTDGQEWLRGKWGAVARRWFYLSAKMARFSSSALVSDCVAMQQIYLEEFGARSSVIPYCWPGIDSSRTQSGARRMGLQPGRYVLVAGRLNPENNTDRVVEAYVRSGAKLPLVVLGTANYDSPVQRRLVELATEHAQVRLLGHVDDRGAYSNLVRDAAAYVHAHSVGGINPSLVEAMGSGARIVALDTPFNREALVEAGSYFTDFERGLPDAIEQVLGDDPAHDESTRRRARELALSRFSLASVAGAYERLFAEVSRRHPWRCSTVDTEWAAPAGVPGP